MPDSIETYGLISGLWTSTFALGAFIGPTVSGVLFEHIGFRQSTIFIVGKFNIQSLSRSPVFTLNFVHSTTRYCSLNNSPFPDLRSATFYVQGAFRNGKFA